MTYAGAHHDAIAHGYRPGASIERFAGKGVGALAAGSGQPFPEPGGRRRRQRPDTGIDRAFVAPRAGLLTPRTLVFEGEPLRTGRLESAL